MGKSKKSARKTPVKVQDLAPVNDPKGGNIVQATNDTKKAIIANFRV
jgi:hypothetical protein